MAAFFLWLKGFAGFLVNLARCLYDACPKILVLLLAGVLAWFLAGSLGEASKQAARADRLETSRDAWRKNSRQWQANAGGWRESFREAERRRARENARAQDAVDDFEKTCRARVDVARRSARAIETIVTREVPRDPQGCPVRGIVRAADGLSDAVGGTAPPARPR